MLGLRSLAHSYKSQFKKHEHFCLPICRTCSTLLSCRAVTLEHIWKENAQLAIGHEIVKILPFQCNEADLVALYVHIREKAMISMRPWASTSAVVEIGRRHKSESKLDTLSLR